MDNVFMSTIHLEEITYRMCSFVHLSNDLKITLPAYMVVTEAKPTPDASKIRGKIRFTTSELSMTFTVIEDSMATISAFASRFNMCVTQHCDIRFNVIEGEEPALQIVFTSNDCCKQLIKDFFDLTSS